MRRSITCLPSDRGSLSLHIWSSLRRELIVEGVGIDASVDFVLNPTQEVAIMEALQRPAGLAAGDVALLLLDQPRPLLLCKGVGGAHQGPEVHDGRSGHELVLIQAEHLLGIAEKTSTSHRAAMWPSSVAGAASRSLEAP